jgi:putative endopeptidase
MSDPLRAIDTTLFDPDTAASDDFYRYVNGGWLDANPIPPEYPVWDAFQEVNRRNEVMLHQLLQDAAARPEPRGSAGQMVGDYFAAAMDVESIVAAGLAPLEPLLGRIDAAASVADIRSITRDLQRFGVGAFHSFGVESDFEDSDAYLVYVGQGGLGLPERDYYLRTDDRSAELRRAYVAHIANQLGNLGEDGAAAREAAERVLAFETRLAEASYPAERMRDVQLTMNRYAVAVLDVLMPGFGLSAYAVDLGVTSPTVNVDNAGFFTSLEVALADTPLPTLRAYLRWHLVRTYASSLAPAFEDEAFDFYGRKLGGRQTLRPRWKRVLDVVTAGLGEQVAQLYVKSAFSVQAKKRCEEMVDHLLAAMGEAIRGAEWMTEATRAAALRKLAGFGRKIGFPDEWRDYSDLSIGRGPYAANRLRCAAFEYDRLVSRLAEPVDRTEWAMPAHSVNAYYHPLLNEVVFPAGILQPPFFYADADDAVNFGAIGAVIGHEITHGFDDQGSRFDAEGRLHDWWTEADRAEFERRAQVLVEQFDAYSVFDDLHVNGRLTLGENIADLGGLSIAHAALRGLLDDGGAPPIDGLTPEQRFFVSWATVWRCNYTDDYLRLLANVDPHSPARARANGPLSNLPAFAAAFGLAVETPMVRSDESRARVW